jgi:hypothetical protein
VGELARVLRPGQPGVILYGRATSRLVTAIRNPLVRRLPFLRSLKRRLLGTVPAPPEVGELYYFAYPPRWFRRLLAALSVRETQVRCLRLVDERVTRRLIPDTRVGDAIVAAIVALERRFPRVLARLASHNVVTFRP